MSSKSILFLIIPLSLSAFTHLWNPVGFPDFFFDEGVYMRRALLVLQGQGPQEATTYYDHPYFGQLFLAGVFYILGYPNSLSPSSDVHSIEMLYIVPRILMGILAVIDTFLIYKISESRYNGNLAFIASILFAVMPMSWFTRRIFLDSILIPFLLTSILFAVNQSGNTNDINKKINKSIYSNNLLRVVLSGTFLGLAIFTKIPVFVTIPSIGFIIFTKNNRSWKILGMWFIPIILIFLIWPSYSLAVGHYNSWWDGIVRQSVRQVHTFFDTVSVIFKIDPVLFVLFAAGLVLAVLRKDLFILLWAFPSLLFLYFIGYSPYRLFIPLIPLFCIAAAYLIVYLAQVIKDKVIQKIIPWVVIMSIGTFGLISTTMLITTNIASPQFEAAAFVSNYLYNEKHNNDGVTTISTPFYSALLTYVYDKNHLFSNNIDYVAIPIQGIKSNNTVLVADDHFKFASNSNEGLMTFYNSTVKIASFRGERENFDDQKYPYTSMSLNPEAYHEIEIRVDKKNKLTNCVQSDSHTIFVRCKSASLTDVFNALNKPKHSSLIIKEPSKVWFLNANLTIENGSKFYVNSTDTAWLKINSTDNFGHKITVRGNLIIDSVKITSWDSGKNDYAKIDSNGTGPRSYIIIKYGTGKATITNSEIAHMGYNHGESFGLTYYSGAGSIIRNSKIHDLYYGYYSSGPDAHNIVIDNNKFYNNTKYGIDPHSGTHDLIISNNTVYDNGKHGIICSTDCYNINIDSNKVFSNMEEGIMLYKNVSNSIIKNNILSNNRDQIAIYDSSTKNKVFNNTIIKGKVGIRVTENSSGNLLNQNYIESSEYGISVLQGASDNIFDSNFINNTKYALYIQDNNTENNVFKSNHLLNNSHSDFTSEQNLFINNTIE